MTRIYKGDEYVEVAESVASTLETLGLIHTTAHTAGRLVVKWPYSWDDIFNVLPDAELRICVETYD